MIHPDIIVNIKFYRTEDNGRKGPTSRDFFGCLFVINSKNHDCRLLLNGIGSIFPGDKKDNIPVKFLCSELVLPKLKKGIKFYLRGAQTIAEGEVKEIVNKNFIKN